MDYVGVFGNSRMLDMLGTIPSPGEMRSLPDPTVPCDGSLYHTLALLSKHGVNGNLRIMIGGDESDLEVGIRGGDVTVLRQVKGGNNKVLFEALQDLRFITASQLDTAYEESEKKNISLSRLLVERKWLSGQDLVRAIRAVKVRLLSNALGASSGAFRFQMCEAEEVPDDPVVVPLDGMLAIWLRHFLQGFYEADLLPPLMPYYRSYPYVPSEDIKWIGKWGWGDREMSVLKSTFNGTVKTEEALRVSALSQVAMARLAIAALVQQRMEMLEEPRQLSAVISMDEILRAQATELLKQDHFSRLGIHWTCHSSEIEDAYFRLCDQFSRPLAGGDTAEAQELISVQLGYIAEAYNMLKDDEKRQEYRKTLVGANQISRQADFMLEQAKQQSMRGKPADAVHILECVLDMGVSSKVLDELLSSCRRQKVAQAK
jgi:hypothetical protein